VETKPADFKTVFDDQEVQRRALRLYGPEIGPNATAKDAVEEMLSRGSWRQANTVSMGRDLARSATETPEQREDHAFLNKKYDELPFFWQKGGRGAYGLADTIVKGIPDPINFLGGPITKGAAWLLGKAGATAAPRIAATVGGRIAGTATADAGLSAGANVLQQANERELGMRDDYSATEAGVAGLIGAGAEVGIEWM
jgi:hypothetical protein